MFFFSFQQAQKQVFNLMKYDCYPRFLRSVIYRQCVEALENHQPPPVPEPTLSDPDLNIDYNCGPGSSIGDGDNDSLNRNMALKKSESDAGERRRRSLLPWPKKDRSKSKVCSFLLLIQNLSTPINCILIYVLGSWRNRVP